MKRLPDLLIIACVVLLVMSMSAIGQTNGTSSTETDTSSSASKRTELPQIIIRSAAKGSWAAVKFTSENVVVPATRYVTEKAVEDVGPKAASTGFRALTVAAKETTRVAKLSLDYLKAKLPL